MLKFDKWKESGIGYTSAVCTKTDSLLNTDILGSKIQTSLTYQILYHRSLGHSDFAEEITYETKKEALLASKERLLLLLDMVEKEIDNEI